MESSVARRVSSVSESINNPKTMLENALLEYMHEVHWLVYHQIYHT